MISLLFPMLVVGQTKAKKKSGLRNKTLKLTSCDFATAAFDTWFGVSPTY